jgi:DNA-binding GntR family transcriptional regulator
VLGLSTGQTLYHSLIVHYENELPVQIGIRRLAVVILGQIIGRDQRVNQPILQLHRQLISTGQTLYHSLIVHYENELPVQLEDRLVNPLVAPGRQGSCSSSARCLRWRASGSTASTMCSPAVSGATLIVHYENELPVQLEDRLVNPLVAPDYLTQDYHSGLTSRSSSCTGSSFS